MDKVEFKSSNRMANVSGSVIRELLKMTASPGMISFAGGNPGEFALPNDQIAKIASDLLLRDGKRLLQYGATEGLKGLIEVLIPYLKKEFGVDVTQSELLPVSGSTQAMDLLCKAYLNPGDVVLVESPTFLGNLQCLKLYETQIIPVESDEEGIKIDALEEAIARYHPKMLYTIPTFQNPTGITLSLERRKLIARLAAKHQLIVAEDDPYRSLRYDGPSLPSIKSFDESGCVVLMGSFSKVISPGLRVGFMAGDAKLIRTCTVCKQSTDVHTPLLNQAIIEFYLRHDLLSPHIQSICGEYTLRRNAMLSMLAEIPAFKHFTKPDGGLFVFAELKSGLNAKTLFEQSVKKGVAFVPGEPFYPEGGHLNTLRLNFSSSSCETIVKGMSILKDCLNCL